MKLFSSVRYSVATAVALSVSLGSTVALAQTAKPTQQPGAQQNVAQQGVAQQGVAQQKTQVPGYFRYMIGDVEVTALYDGYIDLDTKLLKGIESNDMQALLAKLFIENTKGVQTAVNAFLVNTGANLVLVDAGAAKCFGPTLGGIKDNLLASGYKLEQVDTVLLTHLHADHACGLVGDQGERAFPNAAVKVAEAEAGFWLSEEQAAKAPEAMRGAFAMSRESVAPYQAAGKFSTYKVGDSLVPGIKVVPSPGHTPGHTSFLVESGQKSLLIWGDIVHNYAVQFPKPEVAIEFDVNSEEAIKTRKQLMADAAANRLAIAGAHLPFPGLGHVLAHEPGYVWVPVEYGPIRADR